MLAIHITTSQRFAVEMHGDLLRTSPREAAARVSAFRATCWPIKPASTPPAPAPVAPRPWPPAIMMPTGTSSTTRRLIKTIIATSAAGCGVTPEDILGRSRVAPVVRARMAAAYLIRTQTTLSLPRIGGVMGGRDHTTILHSVRAVQKSESLREVAAEIAAAVQIALTQGEGDRGE
jgi:hypothetical protein